MTDIKVVSIGGKDKAKETRIANLLEVIDFMRAQIEAGEIVEFVATSIGPEGDTQIHASVIDLPTGVGLFEIGKHMIIMNEAY